MRRAVAAVAVVVLLPASTAYAADLDELLDESREASYTAEQVITCSTPDGVRDAVVELSQVGGEIHVGAPVDPDVEVASGYGGWTLVRDGAVVSSANVTGTEVVPEPRYTVDEGSPTEFIGREADLYHLTGDGVLRAELVLDAEIGALLRVATFTADGSVYCERRFIAFDPEPPEEFQPNVVPDVDSIGSSVESDLPDTLAGFTRLDAYEDDQGFVFAYYSDGFFSFAVFQTPTQVTLDEGSPVTITGRSYVRSFTPGQVSVAWETSKGGMAMVGDLPPDMHQAVLDGLPAPYDPGIFRRLWRSLFG
ncbi:MAG: hypothetical protein ACRDZM_03310 [Acidimicrobiia bacterium]